MDWSKLKNIRCRFRELNNRQNLVVRSPGRINLIGEHTDYNDGFVLPAAIDKEIVFCLAVNQGNTCNLISYDLQEQVSFELNNLAPSSASWANYLIGVVQQLQKHHYQVTGFDCVFGGDIPIGAGLSSSAALECGLIFGLNQLFNLNLSRLQIATLSQAAENEFVGMQCGLMDQYASVFGKKGHLVQLDCRNQKHREITIDLKDCGLWLFNSNVTHELGDSEYNLRRQDCERGVKLIQKHHPEVKNLRDCTMVMLEVIDDTTIFRRCKYVLEENQRVIEGSIDLEAGDLEAFGEKMYMSHKGLSVEYQVSCPELDALVAYTRDKPDVLGARMMGGGFGGCTINLIRKDFAGSIISGISTYYKDLTGKEIDVYPVKTADGTSLIM